MKNVSRIISLIIIFLTVLFITSCSKTTNAVKKDSEAVSNTIPKSSKEVIELEEGLAQEGEKEMKNETITSFSHDGKYYAEAYGTITGITAGGLLPYEGIRIISVDNDDVIWEMEPGGYTVSFTWSPDSRYVGIYCEGRTWGESIVVDVKDKKEISLPTFDEIVSHYGVNAKPQEDRPDPYFEIHGWEDAETIIVDFRWFNVDGEEFNGQYFFNITTKEAVYL